MTSDLTLRRRAMQLVSQLPDNPVHARRIVDHMLTLLAFAAGDAEQPATAPQLDHIE